MEGECERVALCETKALENTIEIVLLVDVESAVRTIARDAHTQE